MFLQLGSEALISTSIDAPRTACACACAQCSTFQQLYRPRRRGSAPTLMQKMAIHTKKRNFNDNPRPEIMVSSVPSRRIRGQTGSTFETGASPYQTCAAPGATSRDARYEISSGRRSPATRVHSSFFCCSFVWRALVLRLRHRDEWWKEWASSTPAQHAVLQYRPVAAAHAAGLRRPRISHARALKFAGTRSASTPLCQNLHRRATGLGWFIAAAPSTIGPWFALPARAACPPPPPPGTTPSSTNPYPSISSTCRSTPCCAVFPGRNHRLHPDYWAAAAAGNCAIRCRDLQNVRELDPASFTSKAAWNRASCAAPPWSCCSPSPSSFTWAATKCL